MPSAHKRGAAKTTSDKPTAAPPKRKGTTLEEEKRAISGRLREWANTYASYTECAEALGISAQHLNVYMSPLSKKPALPGGHLMIRLAGLGLSLNWLFKGHGSMLMDDDNADAGRETVTVVVAGTRLVVQMTIPMERIENATEMK